MNSLHIMATKARSFAAEYHVDIDSGISHSDTVPALMPLDNRGRPLLHVSEIDGIDYYLSKIDYIDSSYHVTASRLIKLVIPGFRTRSAYLRHDAQEKVIQVHHGNGYLILGAGEHDAGENEDFSSSIFPLDPKVTPTITIPNDHFYTFEAASWSHEPLVISELLDADNLKQRTQEEVNIYPSQKYVLDSTGYVEVPEDFVYGDFN